MEVYDFGLRLKALRQKKNLSQSDVARRLELTRAQISSYECNTSYPSAEKLKELALLYNTSIDYIMGLEQRPCIYLDGFSPKQQQAVEKMVEILKVEFSEKL